MDDGQPVPLHGLLQDRRECPRRRRARARAGAARGGCHRAGRVRPFNLHQAEDLEQALSLLKQFDDVHLMAGGTSLMLLMQLGLVEPANVVSLRRVRELRGISRTPAGGLEIRALVTHRQAELAPEVSAYCPALSETFSHVATIRIRNQATVGGNLAHADPAQDPPPMLIALGALAVVASRLGQRRVPLDELAT